MAKIDSNRRKLLGNFLIFGSMIGVCANYFRHLRKKEDEMVRVITKEGKVMEVNKKHLPKLCAGKASNKRLKQWLNTN